MALARRTSVVQNVPQMARKLRYPQHPFALKTRPFTINPFFIAPVLPGETMKSLRLQSRVICGPINNPLIGWWQEYYFFYIKHRDLDEREEFTQMVLDPEWSDDAVDGAGVAIPQNYFLGTGIDWVQKCLQRICADDAGFFRNTGEAWDIATIDGLPVAQVTGTTWMDSLSANADQVDMDVGVLTEDVDPVTGGTQAGVFMSDIERAMQQYQLLAAHGLTEMTYEDYISTYGVRPKREEAHIPELVRFVRQWQYPSNTIDPADGSPSSAVSWSIQERADKDRFIREPGFLFGVSVTRPKVYLSGQKGTVTSVLNDAFSWLPAVLNGDPRTSYKQVADGSTAGPLGDVADAGGYWFDVKDLFLYGEQFVNFALDATGGNLMALPTAALQRRYVTEAMTDTLFVSGDSAAGIRQDGLVSLAIAGHQADSSLST